MYWQGGKRVWRAAFGALLVAGAVVGGCARPMGILFEPVDPPRVWPPPPDTSRIELVGAISESTDLKAAQSAKEAFLAVLRGPRPPIRFVGPHGVAVEAERLVAVADAAGAAVHIVDLVDRTHVIVSGFGDERFGTPLGVTWAGDTLYVSDARRGELIELSAKGEFRRRLGTDVLQRPVGVAYVAPRDQLYVVDGNAHCLVVLDRDGRLVRRIGGPGVAPGLFNYPTHVCCAGERLLVADSGNFRVQLLDLEGNCDRTIGQKGDGAGDFALPKGVAFDSDGHVYVVDAHFENVQIFDTQGRLLMAFGEEGRDMGRFWLPAGVAIDGDDRIWVADAGNRRLQVFRYIGTAS
jgi:DNA-binding beta-propeller fold protein YncE